MFLRTLVIAGGLTGVLWAQDASSGGRTFELQPGTRIPLSILNGIGTKGSIPGDPVYLQTTFPIVAGGRIVIPPGSYVSGTITAVQRAGKVKGRSEIHVRFDTLTLANGVVRDFRGNVAGLDSASNGNLDRGEGGIKGNGGVGDDVRTVAGPAVTGAFLGTMVGWAAGNRNAGTLSRTSKGLGIGAAAGATAGMIAVLLTRGPDVVLPRGTSVDMVLDRVVRFEEPELSSAGPGVPPPVR